MPSLWRLRLSRLEFLWPVLHLYGSGPQNIPSRPGAVMAKHVRTDKGTSPYSVLPCVLLLLAAGLFVKIGVAAQLIHHLH
jgi:hypothetical protein